jgi:hypothetical protein
VHEAVGGGVVPPPEPPQLSVPWQEFEQDRCVEFQRTEEVRLVVPSLWVVEFTAVVE